MLAGKKPRLWSQVQFTQITVLVLCIIWSAEAVQRKKIWCDASNSTTEFYNKLKVMTECVWATAKCISWHHMMKGGAFHANSIKNRVKFTWPPSILMKFGVLVYVHKSKFPPKFQVNVTFLSRDRGHQSLTRPWLPNDLPGVITPLLGNLQMWCWCHFKAMINVYLCRQ